MDLNEAEVFCELEPFKDKIKYDMIIKGFFCIASTNVANSRRVADKSLNSHFWSE